jgi:anti-sigma B factor antagonist
MNLTANTRQVGEVTIVDISGRIILGQECSSLGRLVSGLLRDGHNKILLNLADVNRIDTAVLAYMVCAYTSARKQGGELKLLNPPEDLQAVMQITKLLRVFDVRHNEAVAVRSFGESGDMTA